MVAPPKPARQPPAARSRPGADLGTLARLGLAEPPRTPTPPKPRIPRTPRAPGRPQQPTPGNVETLNAALDDARYATTPADDAAVQAIAALDTATVERVAAWIRHSPGPLPKL